MAGSIWKIPWIINRSTVGLLEAFQVLDDLSDAHMRRTEHLGDLLKRNVKPCCKYGKHRMNAAKRAAFES